MFSFFKKKKTLRELIPQNFVDMHSHLLYGLDDGAKSLTESQKLIADLKAFGFSQFITTPHTMPFSLGKHKRSDFKSIRKSKNRIENV